MNADKSRGKTLVPFSYLGLFLALVLVLFLLLVLVLVLKLFPVDHFIRSLLSAVPLPFIEQIDWRDLSFQFEQEKEQENENENENENEKLIIPSAFIGVHRRFNGPILSEPIRGLIAPYRRDDRRGKSREREDRSCVS